MYAVTKLLRIPTLGLALALGLAACENPVEDDHEDHPVALVIVNAQNQQVARVAGTTDITGSLTARVGASQTFQAYAVGEDGDRITIDGGELTLQVTSGSQIATATVQQNDRVVVTGNAAGATQLTFTLNHNGHPEFSGSVPLTVAL